MKEFYIYYRGQNINQVRAKNAEAALIKHHKTFAKGSYQTVAMAVDSSIEAFQHAMQQSQALIQS
jgi:uncharacterized membrane protein